MLRANVMYIKILHA